MQVARGKSLETKCEDIVAKIELVMDETEKGDMMRKKWNYVYHRVLCQDFLIYLDHDHEECCKTLFLTDFDYVQCVVE